MVRLLVVVDHQVYGSVEVKGYDLEGPFHKLRQVLIGVMARLAKNEEYAKAVSQGMSA